jgi:hypothetical protein
MQRLLGAYLQWLMSLDKSGLSPSYQKGQEALFLSTDLLKFSEH